jgi:hypothetical protein
MKAVSVYDYGNWDVRCQYWDDTSHMKWAIKWVIHTLVDEKDYEVIVNWKVEEVKLLCFKILSNY